MKRVFGKNTDEADRILLSEKILISDHRMKEKDSVLSERCKTF